MTQLNSLQKGLIAAALISFDSSLMPAPAGAQTIKPCRQLGRSDTVVIIEASNPERLQTVNQVVEQHNLQGGLCASRRTGRTVWMSNQLDGARAAMQVFDYFKSAGLGSPGRLIQKNGRDATHYNRR